jgi:hypothetical protein
MDSLTNSTKILQNWEGGTLLNTLNEARIMLSQTKMTRKQNYRQLHFMNIDTKSFNKILPNQIQ